MINMIPNLKDHFTFCNDNDILDNVIPMESCFINPLSQDGMSGHEDIACTPPTQVDNFLSTQELYSDSENEAVNHDVNNDDSDLDGPDDSLIRMYSIPLLFCSDRIKSYVGTEHHCSVVCELIHNVHCFSFKRVSYNIDYTKVHTFVKTPFANSVIEFSPNTNPPFFRIQHAKGKSKYSTLFFSKVHIDTANRMVKNIGLSNFQRLKSPKKFLLSVPPSLVLSSVKEEKNDNIILKKGTKVLFQFPFLVSKLSLNQVSSGKSKYFTEFQFDNPMVEPMAAYIGCRGGCYTQSSSDSGISKIISSMSDYHSLSGTEWLTDTPVDFYMLWLTRNRCKDKDAYFMPTLMYQLIMSDGPDKVVGYLKKKKIDLLAQNVYVPVCQDCHWTLMVIVNAGYVDSHLGKKKLRRGRKPNNPFPCFLYFNSLGGAKPRRPIRLQLLKLLSAWRDDHNHSIGVGNLQWAVNPYVNPIGIMPLCTIKGVYSYS
jgi:hypothetical protein